MSTREIITIQLGHYSNYVGSHFWNIQELSFDYTGTVKTEVNHDILYREGQTIKGEVTYTPRLLLADLKGSLRSLPTHGGLLEQFESETDVSWEDVETITHSPASKNEYLLDIDGAGSSTDKEKQYHFEKDVTTWTDFLYPRLHPRTINVVKQYWHNNDTESSTVEQSTHTTNAQDGFDVCTLGQNTWKIGFGDSFSDNVRKYVEECDSTQGFQINFDCTDGFAGLAMQCIEHLTDEYGKTILCYPIIASHFLDNKPNNPEERERSNLKDSIRLVNIAISIENVSQHTSLFVPLCTGEMGWRKPGAPRHFEHLTYNPELYYHSSAILASAMDTLSMKYRHKSNMYTLSDICVDMTGYGRKMAVASLGMPFTFDESDYLINHLNTASKPIYTPITPSCRIASDKIFQLITVRGIPESYLKAPLKEAKEQINIPAYRCNSVKEMFELYFQANNFLSATNITVSEMPLELKTPFPQIFSDHLNKYGFIKNVNSQERLRSCPVIAGYHNGNFVSNMLEKLHRDTSRIKFSKLHKFQEQGLEFEEYKETLNRLAEFKDNYEEDFEL